MTSVTRNLVAIIRWMFKSARLILLEYVRPSQQVDMAKWLLEDRLEDGPSGDIQARDDQGKTLVHKACRNDDGHLNGVKCFFELDTALFLPYYNGMTPMHEACRMGHLDVAECLFEIGGAESIQVRCDDGLTPMLWACFSGNLDVAKWLFEVAGAESLQTKGFDGGSPMLLTCSQGHLDVAKWLLEVGKAQELRVADNGGV